MEPGTQDRWWISNRPRRRAFAHLLPLFVVLALLGTSVKADPIFAQAGELNATIEACRTITDDAARLRCFEKATSLPVTRSEPGPQGNWRLVRTPIPRTGREALSIMHTASFERSDPDLAGLIIRCTESDLEVLIALISPFPLRARPQVTLTAGGIATHLEAKVAPPGTALLLPSEATALANGAWKSVRDLSLQVTEEGVAIRGVVTLEGLPSALQSLSIECRSQH